LKLTSGKNPLGIVAATIYISSKIIGEKITQRKLSEISRITQTTIRKRIIGEKITQRKLSEISRITQTTIRKRYNEITNCLTFNTYY